MAGRGTRATRHLLVDAVRARHRTLESLAIFEAGAPRADCVVQLTRVDSVALLAHDIEMSAEVAQDLDHG
jgi:hypothetical protein